MPVVRRVTLVGRSGALALTAALLGGPLAAQLPEAEAAFNRGAYAVARAGYERVLATDSLNERAQYRLAVLDSWDGKLSRSLARFARLRRRAPLDVDLMVAHAQVLAWDGKTGASEALYDSALAHAPNRADALAGRARAVAWGGDLERAERLWRAALAQHPDAAEVLLGLAQTLYWKGQPALAESYATRARAVAPEDRAARELERAVRAALRPQAATAVDGATDSDQNDFIAQDGSYTASLGTALRGTVRAGWRRATAPGLAGTSYGGGGTLIAALGGAAVLRGGLGARHIAPDLGQRRTVLTGELGVGFRPARDAAVSVGYSRSAFDETARLMGLPLTLDAVDVSVDLSPGAGWAVSGGGGPTWFSDGNRRLAAVGAVLGRVLPGLQVGPFGRVMGYRPFNSGTGYFAPDRFAVIEGRGVYVWQRNGWGFRGDGGLGSQQVFSGAAWQVEWHLGFSLSRGWGADNEIALVGSITNSAAATNAAQVRSEAFRYRTLGLRFRQGL
ncbi:MAG TPA: tetratricopeptide repeat protein [Gemmatimonadales bacterium]|nr:tetratricopeptide repeat protein [Gemmatimonadales bacterium]